MSDLTGLSIDGRIATPADPDWDEARAGPGSGSPPPTAGSSPTTVSLETAQRNPANPCSGIF